MPAPKPDLIIGRKPVLEALAAGSSVGKIIVLRGIHGTVVEEIARAAERRKVPVVALGKQEFRAYASDDAAQGVVAVVSPRRTHSLEEMLATADAGAAPGFLLLLDEIEDPHNMGALIRTAECAGVHGVIVTKHNTSPVNATVVKASAGATEHLAIAEVTNLVQAMEELKEHRYWIAGLDMQGDRDYRMLDYTTPIALVVGNEGRGIRRLVREHCDFVVSIPLFGSIESLNASVAGALVMYEAARQRNPAPPSTTSGSSG